MQTYSNLLRRAAMLMTVVVLAASCSRDELVTPDSSASLDFRSPMNAAANKRIIFYGLSPANELIKFRSGNPLQEFGSVSITGLQPGESIIAIDFRPATGQLYGVSNQSRLYIIQTATGAAQALSMTPFTPAISGDVAGFDFNPTVDRIRLVTDTEQNLRLHPETGMVVAVDGDINPGDRSVGAVAYTNSFAGSTSTVLYDIDMATDKLYKQNPPNNGTLEEVGSLGLLVTGEGGFDISPENETALAVLFGRGDDDDDDSEFSNGNKTRFYNINLTNGQATNAGVTKRDIIGLAIPSRPVAYAIDLDNRLLIFNPERSESIIEKPVTGLQPGEHILGIDMRPVTGQLFALGSTSRLYTINTSNGAATMVGGSPFSQTLNGSWFGFDFNPTVDRIRIVSNTGQNLRAHPVTGAVVFVDGALNPGSPAVDAAAYTQNFPGTTATQLFVVDYQTDKLYLQSPPNNGTLVAIGDLGWDIIQSNGFDIGGASNQAMGIFTTPDAAYLCRVDVASGQMTVVAPFRDDVRGFALGLGF